MCFTVWLAAMVDESGDISLLCGVDYFISVQGHEVVMLDIGVRVLFGSSTEFPVIENFTDILHDERPTVI